MSSTHSRLASAWTPCHGVSKDGITVRSLSFKTDGDQMILRGANGSLSATVPEFEVAAKNILESQGYTITSPKAAKSDIDRIAGRSHN